MQQKRVERPPSPDYVYTGGSPLPSPQLIIRSQSNLYPGQLGRQIDLSSILPTQVSIYPHLMQSQSNLYPGQLGRQIDLSSILPTRVSNIIQSRSNLNPGQLGRQIARVAHVVI